MYILVLIFYPGNDSSIVVVPGRYLSKANAEAAGREWSDGGSFRSYSVISAPGEAP